MSATTAVARRHGVVRWSSVVLVLCADGIPAVASTILDVLDDIRMGESQMA